MSADWELLGLAAKAADIKPTDGGPVVAYKTFGVWISEHQFWNPLTDDGDALRLATILHMTVSVMKAAPWDTPPRAAFTAAYTFWCAARSDQVHGEDANAATRRAITECAAQIGKAMP